jgi:hypothetical protein
VIPFAGIVPAIFAQAPVTARAQIAKRLPGRRITDDRKVSDIHRCETYKEELSRDNNRDIPWQIHCRPFPVLLDEHTITVQYSLAVDDYEYIFLRSTHNKIWTSNFCFGTY